MILDGNEPLRSQFLSRMEDDWHYVFALFSRFEYAMKRGGFSRAGHRTPTADWERFAEALDARFSGQFGQNPCTRILFDQPPKKLEHDRQNSVEWTDVGLEYPRTNRVLIKIIKTIRNNMFHGDKTTQIERNNQLIIAASKVLQDAWEATKGEQLFESFRCYFTGYQT